MSAGYPEFGSAIHAALPFLADGGDPHALNPDTFRPVLERYICTRPGLSLSDPLRARILTYWRYLADVVGTADSVEFEATFPNGKKPDLILGHKNRLYVSEIKTLPVGASFSSAKNRQIWEQVVDTARTIRHQNNNTVPIYGYVLIIRNDCRAYHEPEWRLLYSSTKTEP